MAYWHDLVWKWKETSIHNTSGNFYGNTIFIVTWRPGSHVGCWCLTRCHHIMWWRGVCQDHPCQCQENILVPLYI